MYAYGNKTSKDQVIRSKGVKRKDDLDESAYRELPLTVFDEYKKKLPTMVLHGSI